VAGRTPPDLNFGDRVFGVRSGGELQIFFCTVLFAFLLGVLQKLSVLTWCFGGEVVVFCVVDVVFWQSLFRLLKM
jgi:hypothetical protein